MASYRTVTVTATIATNTVTANGEVSEHIFTADADGQQVIVTDPYVAVETVEEGVLLTVRDAHEETQAVIYNGQKGDKGDKGNPGVDGFSPTATVTKSGTVATITITDKNGTTTATVKDGADGSTDWSGITNKPTFATVATSGSYADLSNKPSIPTVPSNVSAFTNDAGYLTSHQDISGKVDIAGDTMTGALIAPSFQTGSTASNYFQSQKFRGEGTADTYYHAIDFGCSGHNQVDFYEYGGVWRFHKHTAAAVGSGDTLVGKITSNGWEGSAKLTGTPTAPTASAGTNTTQIATTAFVKTAIDDTADNLAWVESGTTASRAYAVGDYVTIGGVLCKITAAVASGGTLVSGTNYTAVTGGLAHEFVTALGDVETLLASI